MPDPISHAEMIAAVKRIIADAQSGHLTTPRDLHEDELAAMRAIPAVLEGLSKVIEKRDDIAIGVVTDAVLDSPYSAGHPTGIGTLDFRLRIAAGFSKILEELGSPPSPERPR